MLFAGDLGGFAVLRCCLGVGTCLRLGRIWQQLVGIVCRETYAVWCGLSHEGS